VQAGSSEEGRTLAASVAEAIFTIQRDLSDGQAFYSDIKNRARARGRDSGETVIMPGVVTVVGRTRQEALDKFEQLQALIHPEAGLKALSRMMGVDLTGVDVDGPLPDIDVSKLPQSRGFGILERARRDRMTVRQIYEGLVVAKGHRLLIGSYTEVADGLQEWFEAQAADGFTIMPAQMQSGARDFIELVIPELRRRGLFRESYQGATLREHLGLAVPKHRAVGRAASVGASR
jgi:alkanesulfonate monooxygenase SsuD/methylene tetrahydromethanopterin reductase-like flavin-dependent oxidoreductase (luciferase family)